jgi:hypothetical protein
MMDARIYKLVTAAAAAGVIVACSEVPTAKRITAPGGVALSVFLPPTGNPPSSDAGQTASPERLEVCVRYQMTSGAVPASTNYSFSSVADPVFNGPFSINSAANNVYSCREVWQDEEGGDVTVTQAALPGFETRVTRIEDISHVETTFENNALGNSLTGFVGGTDVATAAVPTGQLFLFTNIEIVQEPPPEGGCTYTQGIRRSAVRMRRSTIPARAGSTSSTRRRRGTRTSSWRTSTWPPR